MQPHLPAARQGTQGLDTTNDRPRPTRAGHIQHHSTLTAESKICRFLASERNHRRGLRCDDPREARAAGWAMGIRADPHSAAGLGSAPGPGVKDMPNNRQRALCRHHRPPSRSRKNCVRPPRWRLVQVDARYPSTSLRLGEPSARWAHGFARMRPGCTTGPATAAATAPRRLP